MAIIPEFTKLRNVIVEDFNQPPHFIPFTSLDLGYVDSTGVLMGHYDYAKGIINVEDEFLTNKNTSDKIVMAVKSKERNLWNRLPEWRVCDGQPQQFADLCNCLLYTSPSPRDRQKSRMPSSA